MGVVIFWLHYIIAGILLYHILRCIYVKQRTSKNPYNAIYERTSEDKRLKHPLWLVLLFILVLTVGCGKREEITCNVEGKKATFTLKNGIISFITMYLQEVHQIIYVIKI